ncbi:NUDIX hydrolase [Goodfellowiella coeruleoviolacea]|uniref:NUDIX domain-containing protein n=1 Tax=Goodfellowiella coeruleoviolacea TaxID=334858 RepID=A0AAE3GAM4_9PSEU|nr:NUDIX domain-containing protein [Goodfellowiella coeruleoviolacea]MCP2164605.1 NUDIX domain-containing protein [Goodfellowiella coeruleoviolacea]
MPELPEELTLPEGSVPELSPAVPATPRDAATVVLVRDGIAGLEVFLLRRVAGMAFAAGMTVFPGGGVDARDADTSVAWAGPEPAWWGRAFHCAPPLARALVCAAVRETFEESGVLLAGPSPTTVVGDASAYAEARQRLVSRELSLAQFLAEAGLVLRADLLRPWANWVTPAAEPRRYDTRFFLACLPEGQHADGMTTEAEDAQWQRPADALADWRAGHRKLLPPTWVTLTELAECDSVANALATPRSVARIEPKVVRTAGALRVVLPGDPGYDADADQGAPG